jgi:ribosome silencing factor RsfS/YbeB/iojap
MRREKRLILNSFAPGLPHDAAPNEDFAPLATAKKTSSKSRPKTPAAKSPSAKPAAKRFVAKKIATKKSAAKKSSPAKPASAKIAPVKLDSVDYLRKQVLTALDELKARDVHEIDVRGKTSIADILIIASGTSTRHVKSLADEVVKFAKKAGMMPLGVEGQREAEWVLVDLGDIIVHVMLPRIREFYGLERLWTVGDDMPMAANAD